MATEYPAYWRIGTSDAVSFDVQARRDNWLDMTLIEWESELPGNNDLINLGVTAYLRFSIGSTATQVELDVEVLDIDAGIIRIKITPANLSGLTWDLGQSTQTVWMDLHVVCAETTAGAQFEMPVFDSLMNAVFPVRVHNSLGAPA